jgi:hypothetical protein
MTGREERTKTRQNLGGKERKKKHSLNGIFALLPVDGKPLTVRNTYKEIQSHKFTKSNTPKWGYIKPQPRPGQRNPSCDA